MFGDATQCNNPYITIGETTKRITDTIIQRFQKGMASALASVADRALSVVVVGAAVVVDPISTRGGGDGDRCWVPNPAPNANEETNTRSDNGLAAFPKFTAVSNTTPNMGVAVVAVEEEAWRNNACRKGTVARIMPTKTPTT